MSPPSVANIPLLFVLYSSVSFSLIAEYLLELALDISTIKSLHSLFGVDPDLIQEVVIEPPGMTGIIFPPSLFPCLSSLFPSLLVSSPYFVYKVPAQRRRKDRRSAANWIHSNLGYKPIFENDTVDMGIFFFSISLFLFSSLFSFLVFSLFLFSFLFSLLSSNLYSLFLLT